MISDPSAKDEIVQSWKGVVKLLGTFHIVYIVPGAGPIGNSTPDQFYNLPFFLAYSVLDEVLTQLRDEGVFRCKSWMLGAKMEASRNKVPWQDYELVNSGKAARNRLAHDAEIISKVDCKKYIEAVETELKAWGII